MATKAMKKAWEIFKKEGVRTKEAWSQALRRAWAIVKGVMSELKIITKKSNYPASKTQLKVLEYLGIDVKQFRGFKFAQPGYDEIAETLEANGYKVQGKKVLKEESFDEITIWKEVQI